jgi:hypothetical protein
VLGELLLARREVVAQLAHAPLPPDGRRLRSRTAQLSRVDVIITKSLPIFGDYLPIFDRFFANFGRFFANFWRILAILGDF